MKLHKQFTRFVAESRRVLKVTRKPTWDEFMTFAKVTGLGLLVIGAIGFLLTFAKQLATALIQ